MQRKTFSELMAQAWEIYTSHFTFYLLAVLFFAFPFNLAFDLMSPATSPEDIVEYEARIAFFEMGTTEQIFDRLGDLDFYAALFTPVGADPELFFGFVAIQVLIALFAVLMNATITLGTARAAQKEKTPVLREEVKKATKVWIPLLFTGLFSIIFLIPLFLFFLIPGMVASVFWIFITPAVVLANKKYFAAFRYSSSLVKTRFFEVLGKGLAIYGMIFLISLSISTATNAIIGIQGIEAIVTTIIQVIGVYGVVFITLYFLELEDLVDVPTERKIPEESLLDEEE